jgi:uncharacterized Zn finger protein (UPF0148 family)
MSHATKCPNCDATLVLDKDGRGICPECGGTIEFRGPKPKVVGAGEFDQVKGEVSTLRETVGRIAKQLGLDAEADESLKPAGKPAARPESESGDEEDEDV